MSDAPTLDDLEAEFVAYTNYLFSWDKCECLVGEADQETIPASELNIEEALDLIKEGGYTPCPF